MLKKTERATAVCVLLGIAVVVAFWPAVGANFVVYDDPEYVAENAQVRQGLSWSNMVYAFTSFRTGNWFPLTWLSHMLVVQLFGLDPSLHHLANIALHIANSALLLVALDRMTGAFWRSALVAGLFALHPMHVESVAWVSERKDVLSTFFFMLMLLAYSRYASPKVENPASSGESIEPRTTGIKNRAGWYWLALVLFACGLMSKSMLVTAPFLLLLLDFWPLGRLRPAGGAKDETSAGAKTKSEILRANLPFLVEKIPFFALSAAASVVTFRAQKGGGALDMIPNLSLGARIANALVSYCRYLGKLVWPLQLSGFYPYRGHWPFITVALASLLFLAVSAVVLLTRRKRPSMLVGWLWFVGSLVPVIGIVQAGLQSIADRYTYLPYIGLFIAFAWVAPDLASPDWWRRLAICAPVSAVLLALIMLTQHQTKYWRDTRTLFEHAAAVSPGSVVAQNNLGNCLVDAGESAEAAKHFAEAVRLQPDSRTPLENLANCIGLEPDRWPEAIELYRRALKIEGAPTTQYNFACLLFRKGDFAEGEAHLREALRLMPDYLQARFYLGLLKFQQHSNAEAVQELSAALRLQTNFAPAHIVLGEVLTEQQKWEEAVAHLRAGLEEMPGSVEGHQSLGVALVSQGKFAEGMPELQLALKSSPDAKTHYHYALALHALGKFDEALTHYREAVRLEPENPDYLNDLAWLLATCAKDGVRNGEQAAQLAEKACSLRDQEARFWGTLDAAYAEAGRFDDAIATAQKARDLAVGAGQHDVADAAERRLVLYKERKPYHQS
jgi:tetratricopeptide (TPR) repeat protein